MNTPGLGTEVKITVEGKVVSTYGDEGFIIDKDGYQLYFKTHIVDIERLLPDVKPGSVYQTDDGPYMARISRRDIPLRFTPADLSVESELTTLPIEKFFDKYPQAKLVFSPAKGRRHSPS